MLKDLPPNFFIAFHDSKIHANRWIYSFDPLRQLVPPPPNPVPDRYHQRYSIFYSFCGFCLYIFCLPLCPSNELLRTLQVYFATTSYIPTNLTTTKSSHSHSYPTSRETFIFYFSLLHLIFAAGFPL